MQTYSWISANMELFKLIYSLIIVFVCGIIVLKAHSLFRVSMHQGIRYFRNAFFFYGIAFVFRYVLGSRIISGMFISNASYWLIVFLFEFFLIMGSFFLLYSLIWKRFEKSEKGSFSSLFNWKIIVFYVMSFIIAFLDGVWHHYNFMFLSQIILFLIMIFISYDNYKYRGRKGVFLKFYFIAMLLSLTAWTLNALVAFYLSWNKAVLLGVYLINIVIFIMFLWGVQKVIGKK